MGDKFKIGDKLSLLMDKCVQLKEAKALIFSTFDNIYQKYNSSSSIDKIKEIFHLILTKSCLMDVSELSYYPINPLPYDSSNVQVSFLGSSDNKTEEEDIDDIDYEEKGTTSYGR